jgi:hypothetical protein
MVWPQLLKWYEVGMLSPTPFVQWGNPESSQVSPLIAHLTETCAHWFIKKEIIPGVNITNLEKQTSRSNSIALVDSHGSLRILWAGKMPIQNPSPGLFGLADILGDIPLDNFMHIIKVIAVAHVRDAVWPAAVDRCRPYVQTGGHRKSA